VEEIVYILFSALAAAVSIYSILILIRIILSWFGSSVYGRPVELLNSVTDPYLNWWRKKLNFRIGLMDFSAVAGIAALSVMHNILFTLSRFQRITLGAVLSVIILTAWSVISFILGFFIVIIILRMVAYLLNCDIYSPFWHMVDSISQPVLYRLNRVMFGKKISGYLKGIILSLLLLAALTIGGNFLIKSLAGLISRIPF
jgi:YggT family protein